jgi:hypothetical protein
VRLVDCIMGRDKKLEIETRSNIPASRIAAILCYRTVHCLNTVAETRYEWCTAKHSLIL